MCCTTLQHTATHCNNATLCNACNARQHTATSDNKLQHTGTFSLAHAESSLFFSQHFLSKDHLNILSQRHPLPSSQHPLSLPFSILSLQQAPFSLFPSEHPLSLPLSILSLFLSASSLRTASSLPRAPHSFLFLLIIRKISPHSCSLLLSYSYAYFYVF